jgi:hypothetical protein
MIDSLHDDGPILRVQRCEQPVVTDAELVLIGRDEPLKVTIRLGSRLL